MTHGHTHTLEPEEMLESRLGAGVEARARLIAGLPRRAAAIYATASLLALIAYAAMWPHAPVMAGDSPSYLTVAQDLADGSIDRLHDRSPGYPLFLIALRSSAHPTRALFFVTLLLHLASIWLLAAVLQTAGVGARLLTLFCLVLVLPPAAESAAYVMTETLAQFLLVSGFAALMFALQRHAWLVVVAAIALGFAALTRPTYQALGPAILLAIVLLAVLAPRPRTRMLVLDRTIVAGIVLVVGSVGILGGYAGINRAATGYFGITPMMGLNLSTRTVSVIERLPESDRDVREMLIRARDAQLVLPGSSHTGYSYIHDVRPELTRYTGFDTPELSAFMLRLNLRLIRTAPLQYLEEVARASAVYWFPSARELSIMGSRRLQLVWVVLHFALLAWFAAQLLVVAGAALFQMSRCVLGTDRERLRAWLDAHAFGTTAYTIAAVMVFYTMLLSSMFDVGDTRQRVPTDAFVLFMTVLGGHWWWRAARAKAS